MAEGDAGGITTFEEPVALGIRPTAERALPGGVTGFRFLHEAGKPATMAAPVPHHAHCAGSMHHIRKFSLLPEVGDASLRTAYV